MPLSFTLVRQSCLLLSKENTILPKYSTRGLQFVAGFSQVRRESAYSQLCLKKHRHQRIQLCLGSSVSILF